MIIVLKNYKLFFVISEELSLVRNSSLIIRIYQKVKFPNLDLFILNEIKGDIFVDVPLPSLSTFSS